MQLSDEALINGIQQHDAPAFEHFFARHRAAIQRHLNGIVREGSGCDDLVQEVFLRVWLRSEQWDGQGSVRAWLYRIATNLALNHLRALRRHPQHPLESPAINVPEEESITPGWLIDVATDQPPALFEAGETRRRLHRLIDELSADKRAVFRLVYEAEMDLQSVAATLGIPEGTVKSRLYYSKKQLAKQWQEEE